MRCLSFVKGDTFKFDFRYSVTDAVAPTLFDSWTVEASLRDGTIETSTLIEDLTFTHVSSDENGFNYTIESAADNTLWPDHVYLGLRYDDGTGEKSSTDYIKFNMVYGAVR